MSEGPGDGSLFFGVETHFEALPENLRAAVTESEPVLAKLVETYLEAESRLRGLNLDPLENSSSTLTRSVETMQRQAAQIVNTYEQLARLGQRPPITLDVALREVGRQGIANFTARAGTGPAATLGRDVLAQAYAQFARDAQTGLRQSLRSVTDDFNEYVGQTANRLRVGEVLKPAENLNIPGPPANTSGLPLQRGSGSGGGGGQPPRAPTPGASDEPEKPLNVVPGLSAEEAASRAARRLAELQEDFAERYERRFEEEAGDRLRRFGNIGFDPLRPEGEQAFHLTALDKKGDDFKLAHDVDEVTTKQKAKLEQLNDLLNEGIDPNLLRRVGNFTLDRRNATAENPTPEVSVRASGARAVPATDEEHATALKAEQRALQAETRALQREEAARLNAAAAEEKAVLRVSGQGLLGNFRTGLTSGGFFGDSTSSGGLFDGLAKSAGTATKYTLLYQTLGLLQGALRDVVKQFLDANDSVTELEVAMGRSSEVTGDFVNSLGDVAAVGGFNVGEAMDVAASGIRAFKDQTDGSQESVNSLGAAFATQASRIAVLSKTTLTDAAGNLKAIATGFNLPANNVGFSQVADAISGAKIAGGGNEQDIGQGLANSALIFKQLGFSLNEAATIVSKINASTDESGQLIANRVSRLSSIIGGNTGKNFINQLNQSVADPSRRVDTQASVRDQLLQLSKIYKDASSAVKNQIVSALGGTAQARETIILLSQIGDLTAKADKGFTGRATQEFEKRLDNVRAQLQQIKGNIDQIITNVAQSGVAAPIIALVDTFRAATSVLREVTQLLNLIPTPLIAAAASAAALYGAFRLIRGISAAGGIGGFLRDQEERLLPQNALARRALEADNKARVATYVAGGGLGGLNAIQLTESAGGVTLANERLKAAQAELTQARSNYALTRREGGIGVTEAQHAELESQYLEQVVAGEKRVAALTEQLAVQEAELAATQRRTAAVADLDRDFTRRRNAILKAGGPDVDARLAGLTQERATAEEAISNRPTARSLGDRAAAAERTLTDATTRIKDGVVAGARSAVAATITGPIVEPFQASLAAGRTFASPADILRGIGQRTGGLAGNVGPLAQVGLDRAVDRLANVGSVIAAPLRAVEGGLLNVKAALGAEAAVIEEMGVRMYAQVYGGGAIADAAAAARARAVQAVRPLAEGVRAATAPATTAFRAGYLQSGGSPLSAGGAVGRTLLEPVGKAITDTISTAYYKTGAIAQASLASVQGVGRSMAQTFAPITNSFRAAYLQSGGSLLSATGAAGRTAFAPLGSTLNTAGGVAARGLGAVSNFLGGPIGIAIAGATIAAEINSAAHAIGDAQKDINKLKATPDASRGEAPREFTARELQGRADSFAAAADNANQARSGFFGTIANILTQGSGDRAVQDAELNNTLSQANANFLKDLETGLSQQRLSSTNLGSTIDTSSAQGVSDSLQALSTSGRGAQTQMDALRGAIDLIAQSGAKGTQALSEPDRGKVEVAGAEAATKFAQQAAKPKISFFNPKTGKTESVTDIGQLTDDQKAIALTSGGLQGGVGLNPTTTTLTPGFKFTKEQGQKLNDVTRDTIRSLLEQGVDIGSAEGETQLEAALKTAYTGILPTPEDIAKAAAAAGKGAQQQAKDLASQAKKQDALNQALVSSVTLAQQIGQEAGVKSQLNSLTTGARDTSAVDAAQAQLDQLVSQRRAAFDAFKAIGLTDAQFAAAVEAYDANTEAVRVQVLAAKKQQAERDVQLLVKSTNNQLRSATSAAQVTKIKNDYFSQVFASGVANHDESTLTALFNGGATDDQIAAVRTKAKKDADDARGKKDKADQAYQDAIGANNAVGLANSKFRVNEQLPYTPAQIAALRAAADAAGGKSKDANDLLTLIGNAFAQTERPTAGQIGAAQAGAQAAISGDTVQTARANLAAAQAEYEKVANDVNSNPQQIAQALQKVNDASRQLSQDVLEQAIAARNVGAFRDSQLDTAQRALKDAKDRLDRRHQIGGDDAAERDAKAQAERAKQLADLNNKGLAEQLAIDLTDPVAVAKEATKRARDKLALLRKQGAPQDLIRQAELDIRGDQNAQEAATHNETVKHAQDLEAAGRISHAQLLQVYKNEQARILERLRLMKKGQNGYEQLQNELLDIQKDIKSANSQLQGQFNLGDIRVPTVYEVRRAIAAQQGSTSAIANSTVNNNTTITINGVDTAKIMTELAKHLGGLKHGVHTTKPRKA